MILQGVSFFNTKIKINLNQNRNILTEWSCSADEKAGDRKSSWTIPLKRYISFIVVFSSKTCWTTQNKFSVFVTFSKLVVFSSNCKSIKKPCTSGGSDSMGGRRREGEKYKQKFSEHQTEEKAKVVVEACLGAESIQFNTSQNYKKLCNNKVRLFQLSTLRAMLIGLTIRCLNCKNNGWILNYSNICICIYKTKMIVKTLELMN